MSFDSFVECGLTRNKILKLKIIAYTLDLKHFLIFENGNLHSQRSS